ncbi:MAG: asparaginase [Paracoccaceae bacterium]|nr:asparaginase [Paracoccaceae bacterium]
MNVPVVLAEISRGQFLESTHFGHAVVCDDTGKVIKSWGHPDEMILPRSSCKMIQALPLITSGASAAFGLTMRHLALACASHQGAAIHTDAVMNWLENLGLGEADFRCGAQMPNDRAAREALRKSDHSPCQFHNNCSGKHSGFLTLSKHLKAGPEYIEVDHPVQRACLEAFEMTTNAKSPGFATDGCSAPNYAASLSNVARSMAWFASAAQRSDRASKAAHKLVDAMRLYPELVAGEGRACTELMQAMDGKVAIKTGAEGVYIAIIPEKKIGIAVKVMDGARRGSECAIAALLVAVGVLNPDHPATKKRMNASITNWRGIETGFIRPAADLIL